ESAVPCTNQDVVLVFATASGWRDGRYEQAADARKIYHGDIAGQPASSIQITTATSVCAAVDLFRLGKLPSRGFVRQEDMSLADFEANRFGKPYAEATHIRAPISSAIDALN
ncbi:MAG: saccharopine dehydrogenase family protein, partial [Planctomycetota bacterium]